MRPAFQSLRADHAVLDGVLVAVDGTGRPSEERLLKRALEKTGHVQARAAEQLGITKSLLQYKMKKYGIKKRK